MNYNTMADSSTLSAHLNESDEEFARRLYDQEMGISGGGTSNNGSGARSINQPRSFRNVGAAPPAGAGAAVAGENGPPGNPSVLNSRYNEASNSRGNLILVCVGNLPQVLVTIIILAIYWNDESVCDSAHRLKWKAWALLSAVRMFLYCAVIAGMYRFKTYLDSNPRRLTQITNLRNFIDVSGLVWFVIGNLWLFGDDESNACSQPRDSPIYGMCLALIIVNYIQICLPCILAALLLPVFCFCMPCLIRILARYNRTAHGASQADISTLPVVTFTEQHLHDLGDDSTCPICLSDIAIGNQARILRCKHAFHKDCVDEWLTVNATCPTCRKSVFPSPDEENAAGGATTTATTVNPAHEQAARNETVLRQSNESETETSPLNVHR